MTYNTLIVEKKDGILRITLNRPEVRNAFNAELIADLVKAFTKEASALDVRVVILKGAGEFFCAGGDIKWMKENFNHSRDQNFEDARRLSLMFQVINETSRPVIAGVFGGVMGGGLGLIGSADYVIASEETFFSFSEARLGLIPATIGPFVMAKIGESNTRALFLTAERFTAERALQAGLIHRIVKSKEEIDPVVEKLAGEIIQCSPQALHVAKKFIRDLKTKSPVEGQILAAQTFANLCTTNEAQEGLAAFLEKRKPDWAK